MIFSHITHEKNRQIDPELHVSDRTAIKSSDKIIEYITFTISFRENQKKPDLQIVFYTAGLFFVSNSMHGRQFEHSLRDIAWRRMSSCGGSSFRPSNTVASRELPTPATSLIQTFNVIGRRRCERAPPFLAIRFHHQPIAWPIYLEHASRCPSRNCGTKPPALMWALITPNGSSPWGKCLASLP
jgi:hypothetical protein